MEDDVIGHVPSYAMPNISSMLPSYLNSEQVGGGGAHVGVHSLVPSLPPRLGEPRRGRRMVGA